MKLIKLKIFLSLSFFFSDSISNFWGHSMLLLLMKRIHCRITTMKLSNALTLRNRRWYHQATNNRICRSSQYVVTLLSSWKSNTVELLQPEDTRSRELLTSWLTDGRCGAMLLNKMLYGQRKATTTWLWGRQSKSELAIVCKLHLINTHSHSPAAFQFFGTAGRELGSCRWMH